jgi:RecA-family ATPase
MTQLAFDFDENNDDQSQLNTKRATVATCINDILNEDITPPTIIIPDFLVSGESTMLCSLAGAAKTFLSQYVAACVATGHKFMDTPINKAQPVLFIDSELSKFQIQQRFILIYQFLGRRPKPGFLNIIHKRSFKGGMPDLSTKEGFKKIEPDLEGNKVIIMDNISSLYRTAEETVQNDWNFYNDTLDEIREMDKSVLVLHHTDKKSENYRGHSEIARAIDHVLIARKDKKLSTNDKTVIKIVNTKNRHSADDGDMLKFEFGAIGNQGNFAFKKIN